MPPITSAVVVGSHDAASAPAARLARALRRGGMEVVAVPRPDPEEVAKGCVAAAAHGALHAVVHAHIPAAAAAPVPLVEVDDAGWAAVVDASVLATLTTLQAARRHLDPGGTVLVVAPAVGLVGAAGYVALGAAGEAQRALAKSAARAWGPAGISVNVVAVEAADLGSTREPAVALQARARRSSGVSPNFDDLDAADRPDDLVDAAMVLLSAAARRITGVTLVADGGGTMLP
jgi:3-oxoacyl-[acyl-carrier protein] reductase